MPASYWRVLGSILGQYMNNMAFEQVSIWVLWFTMSVLFHHCCILIFHSPHTYTRQSQKGEGIIKQTLLFLPPTFTHVFFSCCPVHLVHKIKPQREYLWFICASTDALSILCYVTGLDPAQPCFQADSPDIRLDPSDADFIDVIHTNGRILEKVGLGLPEPIGKTLSFPHRHTQ